MARPSGLGKGLSSIIPAAERDDDDSDAIVAELGDISVEEIVPNPDQPRAHFDEQSLGELAASIAEVGVLQPILVHRVGDGYELIAGERRWRAARRAGLVTIPAIIRTADSLERVEHALVENLHRQDLTPLEEAAAYQQLLDDFDLTHEQLSGRIGKSRSAISNTIRLLGLPPGVQHLLADGQLSAGHARALLGTSDRAVQERLAREAVADGWSVRAVEQAVRGDTTDDAATDVEPSDTSTDDDTEAPNAAGDGAGLAPTTQLRPPGLLELEQLLAEHLDTRVSVQMRARHGRIAIDFADLEDLERIYRAMTGAGWPSRRRGIGSAGS
ncbi:MAG: ParB/RepB/Spo0J family partition protein, partial [Actinomycetota bacterium]